MKLNVSYNVIWVISAVTLPVILFWFPRINAVRYFWAVANHGKKLRSSGSEVKNRPFLDNLLIFYGGLNGLSIFNVRRRVF